VNRTLGAQEDFYRPSSDHRIREIIAEVVQQESTVSLRLAARRVAAHWGFQQDSEKLRERVQQLLPKVEVRAYASGSNVFLWPVGTNPDTYENFRVANTSPESLRDAEDPPAEEVANAVLFLLRQPIRAPEKELARETGHLFGFQRSGERIERRVRAGIELLIQRGAARRDDSAITLQVS
jgi:Protein of unknown function (DUF3320)